VRAISVDASKPDTDFLSQARLAPRGGMASHPTPPAKYNDSERPRTRKLRYPVHPSLHSPTMRAQQRRREQNSGRGSTGIFPRRTMRHSCFGAVPHGRTTIGLTPRQSRAFKPCQIHASPSLVQPQRQIRSSHLQAQNSFSKTGFRWPRCSMASSPRREQHTAERVGYGTSGKPPENPGTKSRK
jgi:hypothetical protein